MLWAGFWDHKLFLSSSFVVYSAICETLFAQFQARERPASEEMQAEAFTGIKKDWNSRPSCVTFRSLRVESWFLRLQAISGALALSRILRRVRCSFSNCRQGRNLWCAAAFLARSPRRFSAWGHMAVQNQLTKTWQGCGPGSPVKRSWCTCRTGLGIIRFIGFHQF